MKNDEIKKNFCTTWKIPNKIFSLKDFYPLNQEECQKLQLDSGREFNLNSMNEILLDMSRRLNDRTFKSKEVFMRYISKAFTYEKREAVRINNTNFKIKNNQSIEEKEIEKEEKYLTSVESSLRGSSEWNFKRKLAATLPRSTAYILLTSYKDIKINKGILYINLSKHITLTTLEKKIILNQAKSIYEELNFNNESLRLIDRIQILLTAKHKFKKKEEEILSGVWKKIKPNLVSIYGKETYHNWFSKLEVIENNEKNQLKLIAPTRFAKDWIESHYLEVIEKIVNKEQYQLILY